MRISGARAPAGEPYVNHVLDVARRLAAARPDDTALIVAGLLHDIVEDTEGTEAEIAGMFGGEVAALVMEVTDDKSLPKEERKRLQIEKAPAKSARGKMLSLADKASNLGSFATSPPEWPHERKRAYLDWAREVVAGCRGVDARLEADFDAAAETLARLLEDAE